MHAVELSEGALSRDKFISIISEVSNGVFWAVFNDIVNFVNGENDKMNNYVAFNPVQTCPSKRLPLEISEYFENIIKSFGHVEETNSNAFFIKAIVN